MAESTFYIHDNRILVDAFVNGSGPFVFIFDTGGRNILTPRAAERLGLSSQKGQLITGAGDSKVSSRNTRVQKYSVGGLVMTDQSFLILDLDPIQRAFKFPALDGIIGYEILEKFVTTIDFARKKLSFSREVPGATARATKISLEIQGSHPVIRAAINGIAGKIMIDTGDRSAFTLYKPFAEKSGIRKLFDRQPKIISGYGVGGPIPAQLANVDSIFIDGQFELKKVLARLPSTESGAFVDTTLAGSLGNEVLRRFTVVFDYKKKVMVLDPQGQRSEPYRFTPLPNPAGI